MVAGHLTIKNGQYICVLDYKDSTGKRKQTWHSTGIKVGGGKKKAEAILVEQQMNFKLPVAVQKGNDEAKLSKDMNLCEFLRIWLEIVQNAVAPTTYGSYENIVAKKLIPYFNSLKNADEMTVSNLQASDVQNYYLHSLKTVKAMTVRHEHAVLHKAMKYAFRMDLIPSNPVDKVDPPKTERFEAESYTEREIHELITRTQDHKLGLLILITVLSGLRRSEALGLRWKSIDFDNNQIHINHTVTEIKKSGTKQLYTSNSTKNKSSCRTLPLLPAIKERLIAWQTVQEQNKEVCGNSYSDNWLGYVFVDEIGEIIKPSYVEYAFPKLLADLGMRRIRFHDLRHTCATLMNLNKVPLKDVQEYLGHSSIQTTANTYTHLDWSSKLESAEAMEKAVGVPEFQGVESPWET